MPCDRECHKKAQWLCNCSKVLRDGRVGALSGCGSPQDVRIMRQNNAVARRVVSSQDEAAVSPRSNLADTCPTREAMPDIGPPAVSRCLRVWSGWQRSRAGIPRARAIRPRQGDGWTRVRSPESGQTA